MRTKERALTLALHIKSNTSATRNKKKRKKKIWNTQKQRKMKTSQKESTATVLYRTLWYTSDWRRLDCENGQNTLHQFNKIIPQIPFNMLLRVFLILCKISLPYPWNMEHPLQFITFCIACCQMRRFIHHKLNINHIDIEIDSSPVKQASIKFSNKRLIKLFAEYMQRFPFRCHRKYPNFDWLPYVQRQAVWFSINWWKYKSISRLFTIFLVRIYVYFGLISFTRTNFQSLNAI